MSARWSRWLPLMAFAGFLGLALFTLLRPAPREVKSALVGRPLPAFSLPAAVADRPALGRADFAHGGPRLLNIFASWCVPCAAESAQLAALKRAGARIDGIAIRDRPEDLAVFLQRYGNPYTRIGADQANAVQVAIGSSGVPETFVVDGSGVIRYQHVGDIRADDVPLLLRKLAEAPQ